MLAPLFAPRPRSRQLTALLAFLAAILGAFGWHSPSTMAALPLLAALWSAAPGRIAAWLVIGSYYLAGSHPLPSAWLSFFAGQASLPGALLVWLAAAALLALPWAVFWPAREVSAMRVCASLLAALMLVSVPPLGIIGWLNPLLSAGSLFSRTGWAGLLAALMSMSLLALAVRWRFARVPAGVQIGTCLPYMAMIIVVALYARTTAPAPAPAGWIAVDTALGHTPRDYAASLARQVELIERVEQVRQQVQSVGEAPVRVLILPEQIAGPWGEAQRAVWQRLWTPAGDPASPPLTLVLGASIEGAVPGRRLNALIADPRAPRLQASSRQPVPFAMWRPWAADGYGAHWSGRGVSELAGQRVLWSICYEDYLVWPFLLSLLADRPTLIVSTANAAWSTHPGRQRLQALHVNAWGRLFNLPVLRAENR